MANVDYDGPGFANISGTVYWSKCPHCGYDTYLADGDDRNCPACSGQSHIFAMSCEGPRIHLSALNAAQLRQLRNQRDHHRELCHREFARGQLAQIAPANQGQWGTSTMEILQDMMNRAAQAQADQLAKVAQQANAWGRREPLGAIKAPARDMTLEEQKRAVQGELMDALEYLIADIADNMTRYPQLEAIARNWAMRRAQAALGHGRAML